MAERGSWALWKKARHQQSGLYLDGVAVKNDGTTRSGANSVAGIGVTGLGLVAECVAAAAGLQSVSVAASRVKLTMQTFAGQTPGVQMARHPDGWLPRFVHWSTGADVDNSAARTEAGTDLGYSTMETGLACAGALFAKNFFAATAGVPQDDAEAIRSFADQFIAAVDWEMILCSKIPNSQDWQPDRSGTGLPMVIRGRRCEYVRDVKDGSYDFDELMYTVWMGYISVCGVTGDACDASSPMQKMWEAWQQRRLDPRHMYQEREVLTNWPAYVVQLPHYVVHPFNADSKYMALFRNQRLASREYYTSALGAGANGRYGLGAGFGPTWCNHVRCQNSGASAYCADRFSPQGDPDGGCRIISAHSVAGYAPADPAGIRADILALLAAGETTLRIGNDVLLWRAALLDADWKGWSNDNGFPYISMVDFASGFFGLTIASGSVPADFFSTYSNPSMETRSTPAPTRPEPSQPTPAPAPTRATPAPTRPEPTQPTTAPAPTRATPAPTRLEPTQPTPAPRAPTPPTSPPPTDSTGSDTSTNTPGANKVVRTQPEGLPALLFALALGRAWHGLI